MHRMKSMGRHGPLVLMVCLAVMAATAATAAQAPVLNEPPSSLEHAAAAGITSWTSHCGTAEAWMLPPPPARLALVSYCPDSSTTIRPEYVPGDVYQIPVVVHVVTTDDGATGYLSDAMVQSQIDILNEDYMAIAGSPGGSGTYGGIHFVLADEDPVGNPTNGIDRVASTAYFNSSYPSTAMKTALHWDTTRYLNIYTTSADNNSLLGWSTLPQYDAGASYDGVIINYVAFGRNSPAAPYNQGRTATHEVGHYLGLYHPFESIGGSSCGNATAPGCYSNGDVICDTPPDQLDTYGCPAGAMSCPGSYPVPIENYMEYTDDTCMSEFTPEQLNRARCSLATYRPALFTLGYLFSDGFEYATAPWSLAVP